MQPYINMIFFVWVVEFKSISNGLNSANVWKMKQIIHSYTLRNHKIKFIFRINIKIINIIKLINESIKYN